MAHTLADLAVPSDTEAASEHETGVYRRCRGRPRLTDSDRARRRHESRKKYDVRRVYLGEAHKVWSELRLRTSLSDAGLAEYLILLHSTYGESDQNKLCGKKTEIDHSPNQINDTRGRVSSLQSIVHWYQDHSESCPLEPQLRSVECQSDSSTAALWQCDASHSFTQYLCPAQCVQPSDAEQDEGGQTEGEEQSTVVTAASEVKRSVHRRRRRRTHRRAKHMEEHEPVPDVNRDSINTMDQIPHPSPDPPTGVTETEQPPVWDVEGSPGVFQSEDDCEDLRPAEDRETHHLTTVPPGYQCVSLVNGVEGVSEESVLGGTMPPLMHALDQSALYDPHSLQAVVSCELPDQRSALENSQLIIITGPSYEALASEGIQLNCGNMEEVACAVIGNVSYNQICPLDTTTTIPRTSL
uniref:Zinc finger protein 653 n=1 Tax=Neogobius melanostomus TaxID=47308 RepID=A0A8C6WP80_9GOBI